MAEDRGCCSGLRLHPAYLCDALLAEELERVASAEVAVGDAASSSARRRRSWLTHERWLREVAPGLCAPSLGLASPGPEGWPRSFELQAEALRALQGDRGGRAPLPRRRHELWAQHKYSIMARDPARGRIIGAGLAREAPGAPLEALWEELDELLTQPAPEGRRWNAVEHMWGYVAGEASVAQRSAHTRAEPAVSLAIVAELTVEHGLVYLRDSLPLSELAGPAAAEA